MRLPKLTAFLQGAFLSLSGACFCRLFAFDGMWLSQALITMSALCLLGAVAAHGLARASRMPLTVLCACGVGLAVVAVYAGVAAPFPVVVLGALLSLALVWSATDPLRFRVPILVGVFAGSVGIAVLIAAGCGLRIPLVVVGGLLVLARALARGDGLPAEPKPDAEAPPVSGAASIVFCAFMGIACGVVLWSLARCLAVSLRSSFTAAAVLNGGFAAGALLACTVGALACRRMRFTGLLPLVTAGIGTLSAFCVAFFPWVVTAECTVLQMAPRYLIVGRWFPVAIPLVLFSLCASLVYGMAVEHPRPRPRLAAFLLLLLITAGALPYVGPRTLPDASSITSVQTALGARTIVLALCCLSGIVAGFVAFRGGRSTAGAAVCAVAVVGLVLAAFVVSPWWYLLPTRYVYLDYSRSPGYRVKYSSDIKPVGAVAQVKAVGVSVWPDGLLATIRADDDLKLQVFGGAVIESSEGRSQAAQRMMAHLPFLMNEPGARVGVLTPCEPVVLEGLRIHEAGDAASGKRGGVWALGDRFIGQDVLSAGGTPIRGGAPGELDTILIGPAAATMRLDSACVYSEASLRRLAGRLGKDGALVCWLPTRGVDVPELAALVGTIRAVLPRVYLFLAGDDVVAVARRTPMKITFERAATLWRSTEVQDYMSKAGFWSVDSVFVCFSVPPAGADRLASVSGRVRLFGPLQPKLRRDLCDLSRPECIALVWQYRTLAAKSLSSLFAFEGEAEGRAVAKRLEQSHEAGTLQTLQLLKRLSDYKSNSEAFAAFLGGPHLDPDMFGGKEGMDSRMRRAVAYERLGFHTKALKVLNEIVASGQADADIFARMGRVYELRYSYDNARTSYKRALDYDPENPDALRGLGRLDLGEGRWIQAGDRFARSLRKAPDDIWTLVTLSRIYGKQGKYDAAVVLLDRVLTLDPHNPAARSEIKLYQNRLQPTPQKPR